MRIKVFLLLLAGYPVPGMAQPAPDPSTFHITTDNKCTAVKDQYLSSTCWSFAGISFIESELTRKGITPPDLSEMYIARCSWINKVQRHLATKGQSFLTPGGQFHDILKVIRRHGLMPEEAYNGKPHHEPNHDHSVPDTLLTRYIKNMVTRGKTAPTAKDWQYINDVLNKYLGKVPGSFLTDGKKITPQQYATQQLKLNADDYIEITSYTGHPYYRPFILEDKYNWSGDEYYNLPLEDFIAVADTALYNGYTVCWDGDITETGFRHQQGYAWLPDTIGNLTQYRQVTYENGESRIDHMMHITGMAADSSGNTWYRVKNSWGNYSNDFGGWLYMNRPFFAIKTVAIIVNKNAIPKAIRSKLGV